jgi:hypothetical protein
MSSVVIDQSECLNCGTALHGAFCAVCGQKAAAPDPTFHDFFHELTHELLHLDGRLWRSVIDLFGRPGFLTKEHCAGRRTRYVAPLRLYLTFSLVFFVIAVYAPLEMSVRMDPKRGRVLHTGGIDLSGDVFEGRSDQELAEWVHRVQHEWMPRIMFVMVPMFAVLTARATRRLHRHFPRHLYFALHSHAAWFGFLSVAEVARFARLPAVSTGTSYAALAAILIYTAVAVRTVYGKSWVRSALQALVTLFGYAAMLIAVTVGLFLAVYFKDLRQKKAGPEARLESPATVDQCASAAASGLCFPNRPFQPSSNSV